MLRSLEDIAVILVSDRRMAEVHAQFMNIADPTDVITFEEGDIFVSVQTAARNAREFATSLEDELRLYIIHGLLHLHGFDDKTAGRARAMRRAEKELLAAVNAPPV